MKKKIEDIKIVIREQKDEKGNLELVDGSIFSVEIVCACGEHRWVKPQDRTQVTLCKPCARKRDKDKAKSKRKARDKRKRAEFEAARDAAFEKAMAEKKAELKARGVI